MAAFADFTFVFDLGGESCGGEVKFGLQISGYKKFLERKNHEFTFKPSGVEPKDIKSISLLKKTKLFIFF